MNKTLPRIPLLKAALKRNRPFVFDSALLPTCNIKQENKIAHFEYAHISRYHQLAGWDASQTNSLHPCYLHMFSFKQHMRLMLHDDFPFALLGIVHLHNEVKQARPVTVSDAGILSSTFGEFKRHNKGITVQIISQYKVDTQVFWSSTSEFLMVDKRLKATKKPSNRADIASEKEWSEKTKIPCDISTIRKYARVSGDFNPIHLHDFSARLFGFKAAIAHGMWSKARCLSEFQSVCVNPFHCKVSFNRPLMLPANVRLLTKQQGEDGTEFQLVSENGLTNHLNGQIVEVS